MVDANRSGCTGCYKCHLVAWLPPADDRTPGSWCSWQEKLDYRLNKHILISKLVLFWKVDV